jgi:hypothetical protein
MKFWIQDQMVYGHRKVQLSFGEILLLIIYKSDEMVSCTISLDRVQADIFKGLGKTIQTISLITFLIEAKKQRGPYLSLCLFLP